MSHPRGPFKFNIKKIKSDGGYALLIRNILENVASVSLRIQMDNILQSYFTRKNDLFKQYLHCITADLNMDNSNFFNYTELRKVE